MNYVRPENDQLCASIIKSGIEATQKYMQEHKIKDNVSRTASISSSNHMIRNQAYALRQKLFGGNGYTPCVKTDKSDSRAASIVPSAAARSPNELYELRRILFGSYAY